jgi:hypothetical protein
MGEVRNAYNILVGKPERKRSLGRPRHRWDLREIELEGADRMHLTRNK